MAIANTGTVTPALNVTRSRPPRTNRAQTELTVRFFGHERKITGVVRQLMTELYGGGPLTMHRSKYLYDYAKCRSWNPKHASSGTPAAQQRSG